MDISSYSLPAIHVQSSSNVFSFMFNSAGRTAFYSSDTIYAPNPVYSQDPILTSFPTLPYNYSQLADNVEQSYLYLRYLIANCGIRIPAPSYGCPSISCWTDAKTIANHFSFDTDSTISVTIDSSRYLNAVKTVENILFQRLTIVNEGVFIRLHNRLSIFDQPNTDEFITILLSILRNVRSDTGIQLVQGADAVFWNTTSFSHLFANIRYRTVFDQDKIDNMLCIFNNRTTTTFQPIISSSSKLSLSFFHLFKLLLISLDIVYIV